MRAVLRLSNALVAALLVIGFSPILATCEKKPVATQPGPVSMTGAWIGSIGDSTLRFDLTEDPSDSVAGTIVHLLGSAPETLAVDGIHIHPDSLFLDAPCVSIPRCNRRFFGHLVGPDSATGEYRVFIGHDPPRSRTWGVARVK